MTGIMALCVQFVQQNLGIFQGRWCRNPMTFKLELKLSLCEKLPEPRIDYLVSISRVFPNSSRFELLEAADTITGQARRVSSTVRAN
jgi:hypothetical protein